MSALGQKQTFAVQKDMSALLPKADMCGALADVCFVPRADIGYRSRKCLAISLVMRETCLEIPRQRLSA
jgi:hypothetical protein